MQPRAFGRDDDLFEVGFLCARKSLRNFRRESELRSVGQIDHDASGLFIVVCGAFDNARAPRLMSRQPKIAYTSHIS